MSRRKRGNIFNRLYDDLKIWIVIIGLYILTFIIFWIIEICFNAVLAKIGIESFDGEDVSELCLVVICLCWAVDDIRKKIRKKRAKKRKPCAYKK